MKRKNKKTSFLRESYKESFDYIRYSRKFIYSIIIIFLFFSLIGFFVPIPPALEARILEFIEELLRKTEGLSQLELIKFIFFNNLQSSFVGMLFGIILGIFPVLSTLANGYLLGFVAEKTVKEGGILILWRILPHGIFELPALFISLGLGLKLGTFIFKKNKLKTLGVYLLKSIKVFFFIVIPLLIIAAIIEGILIFLF
ncbi:MAG TPA: stage II sporulation protein M [Candidatus Nanoarchaeia archaeon]|nr:stage II sporulation protein M [Nanoarchaeota archaeon]HKZ33915.1 stage II sporulation protein M [Candidatus Nanoarchaeia archaeon]